jgi:hypothetical protein
MPTRWHPDHALGRRECSHRGAGWSKGEEAVAPCRWNTATSDTQSLISAFMADAPGKQLMHGNPTDRSERAFRGAGRPWAPRRRGVTCALGGSALRRESMMRGAICPRRTRSLSQYSALYQDLGGVGNGVVNEGSGLEDQPDGGRSSSTCLAIHGRVFCVARWHPDRALGPSRVPTPKRRPVDGGRSSSTWPLEYSDERHTVRSSAHSITFANLASCPQVHKESLS